MTEATTQRLTAQKARIAAVDDALAERFWGGEDIDAVIADRVRFFDELIVSLWQGIAWPDGADTELALFAVGGYGRGELHPYSDIDLLVVTDAPEKFRTCIETFVQALWDLKLDVGHSVRTVEDCDINIQWPIKEPSLSEKDKRLPLLGDADNNFEYPSISHLARGYDE